MSADTDINPQLLLDNVRQVLVRQEETIIFALIERAQFLRNESIYVSAAFPALCADESLVGYMLRETERIHARMRRYTSPDEHPFFEGLPEPQLPGLAYRENPLVANNVNLNARVRSAYEQGMVPALCAPGDDSQYGSSALADVACLQAISRRIHCGKFVAESKVRHAPERFLELLRDPDPDVLMAAITDEEVEQGVLARVWHKAETYLGELMSGNGAGMMRAETLVEIYKRWIIPMNKDVQVAYLQARATHHDG